MTVTESLRNNFSGGEISPALALRNDLTKYQNGLNRCENMIVRPQGGVYSRAGTKFIGALPSTGVRLIPFSFNTEQNYVLIFSNNEIRVLRDGVIIQSGGSDLVIPTSYTSAQLKDIDYAGYADTMTLVHRSHPVRRLTRSSDTSWSLDVVDFSPTVAPPEFQPEIEANITNLTFSAGTETSVYVEVDNLSSFQSGDVVYFVSVGGTTQMNTNFYPVEYATIGTPPAGLLQLFPVNTTAFDPYTSGGVVKRLNVVNVGNGAGSYTKDYFYVVTAVDKDGVESLPSIRIGREGVRSLTETWGNKLTWSHPAPATIDYYRVYKDISGDSGIYGWIGDSSTAQFTDFNIAPVTSDAPPSQRDPLGGANDRPGSVSFYQQRQVFANTNNEPQTIHATQTGNYLSFRQSSPVRDSDAFSFVIASPEINEIRYLVSMDTLLILTSGAEWRVTEGNDQVFTPTSVGVRVQSRHGCANVKPVIVGDSVLYVQEKGGRLRDLSYAFTSDSYGGSDLSIMSQHLFRGHEVTEMHYAKEPDGIVWCLRNDGIVLGLTYQKEHQVWAWHQHNFGGTVKSICVIGEGEEDVLYAAVERTVGGSNVTYMERLASLDDSSAITPFCVDSGLSYNGAPTNTFTGMDHLEGEHIVVLADGVVYGVSEPLQVSSGGFTLPTAHTVVHAGLPYTVRAQAPPPFPPQSSRGFEKAPSDLSIYVERSRGVHAAIVREDGSYSEFYEARPRAVTDGYGAPSLITGALSLDVPVGWDRDAGVVLEQRNPLPLNVLAIEYTYDGTR